MTEIISEEGGGPRFLRRTDAAKYLREKWGLPCQPRSLAKIACVSSDGPEMHYAGRIPLYTPKALDAYAVKKISPARRSTSDRRTANAACPQRQSKPALTRRIER
jgi:hypothetical protein